jgi:hypothetical protein
VEIWLLGGLLFVLSAGFGGAAGLRKRRQLDALGGARLRELAGKAGRFTVEELAELDLIRKRLVASADNSPSMLRLQVLMQSLTARRIYSQRIGDALRELLASLRATGWHVEDWPLDELDGVWPVERQVAQAVEACVGVCAAVIAKDGAVAPEAWASLDAVVLAFYGWFGCLRNGAAMRDVLSGTANQSDELDGWTPSLDQALARFTDGRQALFPDAPAEALGRLRANVFGVSEPSDEVVRRLIEQLRTAFSIGHEQCLAWTGGFGELEQLVERAEAADPYRGGSDIPVARRAWALLRQLAERECLPTFTVDLPRRRAWLRAIVK